MIVCRANTRPSLVGCSESPLFVLHAALLCAPQFPDVGLAIELDDSCAISWDGRECAHCTSAPTEVGGNELLSLFFSLPTNVMNAAQR